MIRMGAESQSGKDWDRLPQSYTGIVQEIKNLVKGRLWKRRH